MKSYKIGVFGAGRGESLAKNFKTLGCEIVAVCDSNERRRNGFLKKVGEDIPAFSDFDTFIGQDMDAVIIANGFHEHAPFVIKCFERGIHVYCECISNGTMAEGVELLRAAEKTDSIFMLAENYPQMLFNREIKRVCDGGTLGKLLYAEGEYNHPVSPTDVKFIKRYRFHEKHWRNFNPRTYYITHSLAPIMHATGATPKRVTAFTAFHPHGEDEPTGSHVGDRVAIITTKNDDESVFKVTGAAGFGAHGNSYRVCGAKGQIENLRGTGGKIMLRYNAWSIPEGAEEINLYKPEWKDRDEELIKQSGHGGGDFITARMFLECLDEGRAPEFPFDLNSAVTMSSVAILAHRSMLEGGAPYDIPDLRLEEEQKRYENDRLTPYYLSDGTPPSLPCCSHTDYKPTERQLSLYREIIDGLSSD